MEESEVGLDKGEDLRHTETCTRFTRVILFLFLYINIDLIF